MLADQLILIHATQSVSAWLSRMRAASSTSAILVQSRRLIKSGEGLGKMALKSFLRNAWRISLDSGQSFRAGPHGSVFEIFRHASLWPAMEEAGVTVVLG